MPLFETINIHIGKHEIQLIVSKSDSDFGGRWIDILDSKFGNIHMHLNKKLNRIQAWIFRTFGWDEICLTHLWHESDESDVIQFIQGALWIKAVEDAKCEGAMVL